MNDEEFDNPANLSETPPPHGPSSFKPKAVKPGLYLVSTPIGNLRDITLRALDILHSAHIIACEDTRITRKLCQAYGIKGQLLAYHEHNAEAMRPHILEALNQDKTVAIVSDAGTPLVSDPGFRLVDDVIKTDHAIIPIPGASAPLTALVASGLPTDRFLFAGFLPTKTKAKENIIEELSPLKSTLIFFESPRRIAETLRDFSRFWPNRQAVVARELTKMFEEFRRDSISALADHYGNAPTPKGEIVLLIGPPSDEDQKEDDWESLLDQALLTNSVRDAAAIVAETCGLPRKQVYKAALARQSNAP